MERENSRPPRYRIEVKGRLGERFGSEFEGMTLERRLGRTVLCGPADQARLHGILDQLRDLGIELVSVNADD